jgi:hypothetical protein
METIMTKGKRDQITVAERRRSHRERIRIRLEQYRGRNVVSLWTFWTGEDGKEHAGRQGISLDVSHTPKLARGFKKARLIATKRGLLDRKARDK